MRVCGNVCYVAAVVKNSVFFSLGVLKYVCVRGVFLLYCDAWSCRSSCIRHADVVCLCLVCILWQFSMLNSA